MSARFTVATYRRWNDATGTETPVVLVAHVAQDGGTDCGSELCIVWHAASIAEMQRLGFTAEEYVGAIEAMEARFTENEQAECRVASTRQRVSAERAVA